MKARSRPHGAAGGYLGPTPPNLSAVLEKAWRGGFSVASNFSREHSTEVALAASCGWISTVGADGMTFGRSWFLTFEGMAVLKTLATQGTTEQ